MRIIEHIDALRGEGELLASAARRAPLDAPVPTCPDWTVGDLVRHIGTIHRWATAYVAGGHAEPMSAQAEVMVTATPDDADLFDWYTSGHAALVAVLEAARDDLGCFTFLPGAVSGRAFWARRQAHETAIHRVDAQSATGTIDPVTPPFARDGIDELLRGFYARRSRRRLLDEPRRLSLHATDTGDAWLVEAGGPTLIVTGPRPSAGSMPGRADVTIRATASDLYLLLWNRRPATGLDVTGDTDLLDWWRAHAQVVWG